MTSYDARQLKQYAQNKFQTLERFAWPGGKEPRPPTNRSFLRMYGHNLCPFVERARWTFSCKEVPFQEVWLDMNDKASWHMAFNAGFVPILEIPTGEIFPESGIVTDFANQCASKDQGIKLIPDDATEAARMRTKMNEFDKTCLGALFGCFLSRYEDMAKIDLYLEKAAPYIEKLCG